MRSRRISTFFCGVTALGFSTMVSVVAAETLDDMAAPISHPTIFEDPRNTTELRPIYVFHKISDDFVTGGGQAVVYALQARYAFSERFSLIATKDGYVDLKTDDVLDDESGWADVAAGVKYAAYLNPEERQILSLGLRYEIPMGDEEVFQGQESGAINPFISGAIGLGAVNLMGNLGFRVALDDNDSSFFDLNLHADTKFGFFHPVVELNVVTVTQGGKRLPIADEGEDFFNFGATKSDGETLVVGGVGGRFDLTDRICLGVMWQFPLSNGNGTNILDYRVTSDMIFRF